MTGFVTDISKRDDYLRARQGFFTTDPPASTLVEISALAAPGLIVEVEVMAIIGSSTARASRSSRPKAAAGRLRERVGKARR
jgi:2-iminobutanoate/2-iminopropanoate deaminase